MAKYEQQFRAAVLLVDCCHAELSVQAAQVSKPGPGVYTMDLSIETLGYWMTMAARDGALAIYHFGSTIDAIKQSLPASPTLNSVVDHPALRKARSNFRKNFPRYEAIRHVVSHAADFAATPAKRSLHSHKGPLVVGAIKATGSITARFSDNLFQRTYLVSYEGKAQSYEITQATADQLFLAKVAVYSSFDFSTMANPTR